MLSDRRSRETTWLFIEGPEVAPTFRKARHKAKIEPSALHLRGEFIIPRSSPYLFRFDRFNFSRRVASLLIAVAPPVAVFERWAPWTRRHAHSEQHSAGFLCYTCGGWPTLCAFCKGWGFQTLKISASSILKQHRTAANKDRYLSWGFKVESVNTTADLESPGYPMLIRNKTEPWGQTVSRFLSPEGLLVAVTFTPALREEK
jgi:hypothetical protein